MKRVSQMPITVSLYRERETSLAVCGRWALFQGELSMIVVLTEEPSSAEMLKRVIPKILPDMLPQLDLQIVEHRGIGDLKAKLPSLLRGWPGDARFIVVCDRDRRDCVEG